MKQHILCVGKICGADFEWHFNMPPVEEREPVDGSLQDAIDIANADAMAEEWQDAWLDADFFRHGC